MLTFLLLPIIGFPILANAGFRGVLDIASSVLSILFFMGGDAQVDDASMAATDINSTIETIMASVANLQDLTMDQVHDYRDKLMLMSETILQNFQANEDALSDLLEQVAEIQIDEAMWEAIAVTIGQLQEIGKHKAEAQGELMHSQAMLDLLEGMEEETAEKLNQWSENLEELNQEQLDQLTKQALAEALLTNRLDSEYIDRAIEIAKQGVEMIEDTLNGFKDIIGDLEEDYIDMLKEQELNYQQDIALLLDVRSKIESAWWHLQEQEALFLSSLLHYASDMYMDGESPGFTPEQQIQLITSISESNFKRQQYEMDIYYDSLVLILDVVVEQSGLDHDEELAELKADSALLMAKSKNEAALEASSAEQGDEILYYLYEINEALNEIQYVQKADLANIRNDKLASIQSTTDSIYTEDLTQINDPEESETSAKVNNTDPSGNYNEVAEEDTTPTEEPQEVVEEVTTSTEEPQESVPESAMSQLTFLGISNVIVSML